MTKPPSSPLSVSRGLRGAILSALLGAVAPAALYLGWMVCRWLVSGADEYDRHADLRDLKTYMLDPILGCATVFACTGWAAFAPVGRFRFARTLAIIASVSVVLWLILGIMNHIMELTPHRYKGGDHPAFYLSESILFFGPPILVTAFLTASRALGASRCWKPKQPLGADDLS